MLESIPAQKIDISDQDAVLDEMNRAYAKFEVFLNKMKPAWDKMDEKEQLRAIASGKFPLITYGQYMLGVLQKWFQKEP